MQVTWIQHNGMAPGVPYEESRQGEWAELWPWAQGYVKASRICRGGMDPSTEVVETFLTDDRGYDAPRRWDVYRRVKGVAHIPFGDGLVRAEQPFASVVLQ